uniref:LOB domain-containing protein 41-like n=1 Tax=Erigeron canadensis TaxID=72917 RepID=UPI001CB8B255|nr:LOB domain-containing protein 41-like [Erigeron canadensis]
MRMSCNGCRVLRKGCSDDCSIRPCLQWIKSPESQANATVFLAKFYGRAGLMNLVNSGPDHLRPAVFRSLLYEACGRIVNPIYGSVGLLWSGKWQLCQNAVEAVLNGSPIIQVASDPDEINNGPPLKAYDIRHISKDDNNNVNNDLHRIRTRCRFKKSGNKVKKANKCNNNNKNNPVWVGSCDEESGRDEVTDHNRAGSHDDGSTVSHQSEGAAVAAPAAAPAAARVVEVDGESCGTAEVSLVTAVVPVKAEMDDVEDESDDIGLELRLGFGSETVYRCRNVEKGGNMAAGAGMCDEAGMCRIGLGLDCEYQV